MAQILARLRAGHTVKECVQVINTKMLDQHFIENPKYLNPVTLFRKSNFDRYINEVPEKTQHDKLVEAGKKWLNKSA